VIELAGDIDISVAVTKASQIKTETPVKETHRVVRTEDHNGNKMINKCVRECNEM
jgi:hypothetical protein